MPDSMITKPQAQTMRLRIIAALDTDDSTSERDEDNKVVVDIDQRFVKQIFPDTLAMSEWCKTWNIETTEYEIPHTRRTNNRSQWVRFKKPDV